MGAEGTDAVGQGLGDVGLVVQGADLGDVGVRAQCEPGTLSGHWWEPHRGRRHTGALWG